MFEIKIENKNLGIKALKRVRFRKGVIACERNVSKVFEEMMLQFFHIL